MIRVLIVDDHEVLRFGCRAMLESAGDILVMGECATGEEALTLVPRLRPDVLVCDLFLPGISGLTVAQTLMAKNLPTRVVMLSAQDDGSLPRHALALGVHGYLSKGCSVHELRAAVRAVHAGERYVGNVVARNLVLTGLDSADSPFARLTAREMEIVLLLLRGHGGTAIAQRLRRSNKTVSSHKANAFAKLGVRDLAALQRLATSHGLIEPASR